MGSRGRGRHGCGGDEDSRPATQAWQLDLTRLEDNRQALRERLRNHDLEGKLRLSFRSPACEGSQLLSRPHPLVVELADFVAERALSGLEPELAARASVLRTKAVAKRTQVLVLRLRHQLHQSRWTGSQYEALPDLLVEECLTARVTGDGVEPLEGAAALELLEAPASGTSFRGSASSGCRRRSLNWMGCSQRWRPWRSGVPTWRRKTTAACGRPRCVRANRCGCASAVNPACRWM